MEEITKRDPNERGRWGDVKLYPSDADSRLSREQHGRKGRRQPHGRPGSLDGRHGRVCEWSGRPDGRVGRGIDIRGRFARQPHVMAAGD